MVHSSYVKLINYCYTVNTNDKFLELSLLREMITKTKRLKSEPNDIWKRKKKYKVEEIKEDSPP